MVNYVQPPTTQPRRYGVFSVSSVIPGDVDHWQLGVVADSDQCAQGVRWDPTCDATNDPKTDLEQTNVRLEGAPFAVLTNFNCGTVGITADEIRQRLLTRLAAIEEREVEKQLWDNFAADTPEVYNSGTAVSTVEALSWLEQRLGELYGGIGIIHSSRGVAPYLTGYMTVSPEGPVMRTKLGTAWAFGAGYGVTGPAGQPPPGDGEAWIYATGAITFRRGEPIIPQIPESVLIISTNQWFGVAERVYVPLVDCPLLAARITLGEA